MSIITSEFLNYFRNSNLTALKPSRLSMYERALKESLQKTSNDCDRENNVFDPINSEFRHLDLVFNDLVDVLNNMKDEFYIRSDVSFQYFRSGLTSIICLSPLQNAEELAYGTGYPGPVIRVIFSTARTIEFPHGCLQMWVGDYQSSKVLSIDGKYNYRQPFEFDDAISLESQLPFILQNKHIALAIKNRIFQILDPSLLDSDPVAGL
jgi:hypothetical protein